MSPTVCPVSWPFPAINSASPGPSASTARKMASARSATSIASGAAAHHGGPDQRGVLRAGIVIRDKHQIGIFGAAACPIKGRLPVSRSPPAPNNGDKPPHHMRAHCFERRFDGVGGMGVIHENRRAVGRGSRPVASDHARFRDHPACQTPAQGHHRTQ